jgi:hypothetical protein
MPFAAAIAIALKHRTLKSRRSQSRKKMQGFHGSKSKKTMRQPQHEEMERPEIQEKTTVVCATKNGNETTDRSLADGCGRRKEPMEIIGLDGIGKYAAQRRVTSFQFVQSDDSQELCSRRHPTVQCKQPPPSLSPSRAAWLWLLNGRAIYRERFGNVQDQQ